MADESILAQRLTLYAHSAVWQHKARFTLEEREDITSIMICKGFEQARCKDFTGVTSPGGWIIRCMHNALNHYMDKAIYRSRMIKALRDHVRESGVQQIPLRRQGLEADRWVENDQPNDQRIEFNGYGTQ